ncbi:G protein-coupled receptor, class C, group 5, member Bb [Denticeps clupeoides]|uniref:G-protein coupled receptors family 3 profile domain-containing protein n=1 Tax=Denticeps clupeoides TaxID=299321 RepID=A0AAY4DQQ3_9TELE|nr:G-protein coupled receptor family C group 5 member B-like [Denticeps clupeoides]
MLFRDYHYFPAMALNPAIFLVLSLIGCSSSETQEPRPPPPRGCGSSVDPPYHILCDLELVWGVVVEAVACGGAVAALVLALVLLIRLHTVPEPERRCSVGLLLLLLAGTVSLFALSFAFLVGRGDGLCMVRRGLWGPLFALCFASLLVQGLRLRRLAGGKRSPSGASLAVLAVGLSLVQGVIAVEWLLLTVMREGHAACDYLPVDFALACSYALGVLLMATGLSLGVLLCGGGREEMHRRKWRCNGVWLFLSCLASLLIWGAWLGFYLYGEGVSKGLHRRAKPDWDEPALAVALVTEGWALLLFHAIPEAHLCLRKLPQQNSRGQEYYSSTRQPSAHHQEQAYEEEAPPTAHRPTYADNQAFTIEEPTTVLRPPVYHNGLVGPRPVIPFRSHVYQPTEMAVLMNGGAIPTAPPNFTGRQLW